MPFRTLNPMRRSPHVLGAGVGDTLPVLSTLANDLLSAAGTNFRVGTAPPTPPPVAAAPSHGGGSATNWTHVGLAVAGGVVLGVIVGRYLRSK